MNLDNKFRARLRVAVDRAIGIYGEEHQARHVQEECAELIAAINKCYRGRAKYSEVRDEIADLILCTESALTIFGHEGMQEILESKLARYEARLDRVVKVTKVRQDGAMGVGYCYRFMPVVENNDPISSPDEYWDIETYAPKGTEVIFGYRKIDGVQVRIWTCEDEKLRAQRM